MIANLISHPFHWNQEPIANLRQGLDELGTFGGVLEGVPQLFHGGVHSVLEVHKCILRPDGSAQLLAGDDLSFCLQ